MRSPEQPQPLSSWKRQAAACAVCGLLLAGIIAAFYLQHRQREWILRREQAQHRVNIAFEFISRDLTRVRADALYLAKRKALREFVAGDESRREELAEDFILFVQQKELYDQIRLLYLTGEEKLRVNLSNGEAVSVNKPELQDKSDRYYFQEALSLERGEIFVSDFDLNLEHGVVERPLKPVIRFVTPVAGANGEVSAFLVLNYLGAELLNELDNTTVPGYTLLLRHDGHYIRGFAPSEAWGWVLDHDRTFSHQFPSEWSQLESASQLRMSHSGAFAAKSIPLGRVNNLNESSALSKTLDETQHEQPRNRNSITIVSYLPREAVFASSNQSLQRMLLLGLGVFALTVIFVTAWTRVTLTRRQQSIRIAESEERLRELSSRLLRIQEDERRAISREIHDELGQQATAINLDLKLAQRNLESGSAMPHLQRAIGENETLLQALHEFAKRVRPALLDDLGLKDAIESQLKEFKQRTGVNLVQSLEFQSSDISDEIADNAFRLIQECLSNVSKHADATTVEVAVTVVPQGERELLIRIRDDGRGHANVNNSGRLGLVGMRERIDLLSGKLDIQTKQSEGTCVEIRLPLSKRQEGNRAWP